MQDRGCFVVYLELCMNLFQIIFSYIVKTAMQVEATDPASGALYYYNEKTGMSQWERPSNSTSSSQPPPPSNLLPENWMEALDETTGIPYAFAYSKYLLQLQHEETHENGNAISVLTQVKNTFTTQRPMCRSGNALIHHRTVRLEFQET